ncbi:hypothetical protein [Loktanella sp. M215]|uniref:hypothetical protein n=1 Tax=Loktanella sp. M215 TaxID=2675431 RepID=UPI001F232682|nr:hypothetical protein [Loktanella sp. M215]MCF7702398.1 hypothetical protein [Loktanella sp. M215]
MKRLTMRKIREALRLHASGRRPGAFKLTMSSQRKWRKLDGQNRLPEIVQGVEFRDGLRRLQTAA